MTDQVLAFAEPTFQPRPQSIDRQRVPESASQAPLGVDLLLRLQRSVGNAAVSNLVRSTRRSTPLQRGCGAECTCETCQSSAAAKERVMAQAALPSGGSPSLQGEFVDGTADAPSDQLPPGSAYASMDADLLAMLGRTLKAKSFWRWANARPTNLGAALDLLGPADLDTLVQLKGRLMARGLWANIETIRNLWSTSSLGVDYNGPSMQSAVDASDQFCKDTMVGESYHDGSCWREVVQANTPGLHFCTPNSVHIDPHQTSVGRHWGIDVGGDSIIGSRSNVCSYSLVAFISHMTDVEGGRAVNMFERFEALSARIARLKDGAAKRSDPVAIGAVSRLNDYDQKAQALAPVLRGWAVQGFEGGDAGPQVQRTDQEMDTIEQGCKQVEADLKKS
jgi:hypothetical protein